jgi:hypothetical protein
MQCYEVCNLLKDLLSTWAIIFFFQASTPGLKDTDFLGKKINGEIKSNGKNSFQKQSTSVEGGDL